MQNQATRHREKFNRNFRDSVPGVKVCSGSASQADIKHGGKSSCYGNSLVAACFEDPALWKSKDFSTVLDAGVQLYNTIKKVKTTPHDYLEASDAKHLGGHIVLGTFSTAYELDSTAFQGYLFINFERQDQFAPLTEAIRETFAKFDRALVVSKGRWFCLAKSQSKPDSLFS